MLRTVLIVFHVFLAVSIIGLVLLQRGKGADAGAGFGAGASGTVFGSRGSSSFFSRATGVLATLFFATSLTLAYLSGNQPVRTPDSIFDEPQPAEETTDLPDLLPAPGEDVELPPLPDVPVDELPVEDLPVPEEEPQTE